MIHIDPQIEIAELKQQIAQLRAALEDVEWYYLMDDNNGHPVVICPKCGNRLGLGHKEDCKLAQALAAPMTAGEQSTMEYGSREWWDVKDQRDAMGEQDNG